MARWTTSWLVGLALAAAAPLAGCGFEPVYATRGVSPALSRIEVAAPKARVGFLLGEHLDDELARDRSVPPKYRLILSLRQSRYVRGIRANSVANRYELILSFTYTLVDAATGKGLTSAPLGLEVSYDAADPPYSGVAAEQDAEDRAARQAAVLVRLDLTRYFAGLPGK